jgi:hypothetical protein
MKVGQIRGKIMKRSIMAVSIFVIAGILFITSAALAEPPKALKQMQKPYDPPKPPAITLKATLSADPASSSSQCPAVINFKGTITVSVLPGGLPLWPIEVKYRFKRSDGATDANIKTPKVMQAGSKDVSDTWTLGGSARPAYCDWESIEIISPQAIESNHAGFNLDCSNALLPNFQITDIMALPMGNNTCDLAFKVKNTGGGTIPDADGG